MLSSQVIQAEIDCGRREPKALDEKNVVLVLADELGRLRGLTGQAISARQLNVEARSFDGAATLQEAWFAFPEDSNWLD